MRGMWRAVSVDLFTDPLFRGNDELVAWLLIVTRYARAFDDADRGLRRGQFRASVAELTRRFQKSVEQDPARRGDARWTVGKTRAFIARLERHGALSSARSTDETGRPVTLFTVENYGKWQQTERTPNNEPNADRTTNQNPAPVGTPGTSATGRATNRTQTEEQTARTHRETGFLETETKETKHTPSADGGNGSEDFALEGQSSAPEKPTRGVVVNGERWLETLPRDEKNRPVYPSTFSDIWNIWLNAQKRPGSRAKAADKAQTYRLVRDHLKDGTPYDDIVRGTERYLAINWNQIGCVQPPRFCRRKDPMFLDHLDASGSETNGVTYSRDDFPNLALLGGYLAIVMRAHNVEGAPGRPVPPDDAWRVFQEQPPEIQAQVKAGVMS